MKMPTRHEIPALLASLQSRNPAGLPAASSKDIILYGAGGLGALAANFFQHVGVHVSFAIDKKANPHMLEKYGIPVLAGAQPAGHNDKILLVSTLSEPYSQISAELQSSGWQTICPFYDYAQNFRHRHPLNNGWFCGNLSSEDIVGISGVIEKLEDRHSLGAYLQFIAWRLLREDWLYDEAPVIPGNRYFIPQIEHLLSDTERFLDIGAYDGRVLLNLLKRTRDNIESALMIEPDAINRGLLQKTVRALPQILQDKITLQSFVVSNISGLTSFSQGFDFASRECEIASSELPSVTLDDLALSSTFIKIHTEGNELAVLHGAKKTLLHQRPKIAITLYHSRDGLWKIPTYLISLLDEYAFYFRGHTWCGTGAVFYAIPRDRK
jgi:FkbM family methyltransferase